VIAADVTLGLAEMGKAWYSATRGGISAKTRETYLSMFSSSAISTAIVIILVLLGAIASRLAKAFKAWRAGPGEAGDSVKPTGEKPKEPAKKEPAKDQPPKEDPSSKSPSDTVEPEPEPVSAKDKLAKAARAQIKELETKKAQIESELSELKRIRKEWESAGKDMNDKNLSPQERAAARERAKTARDKLKELTETDSNIDLDKNVKAKQGELEKEVDLADKDIDRFNKSIAEGTYDRPSFRAGVEDKVWTDAKKGPNGGVIDPSGTEIMPGDKWIMGHRYGYEFWKHKLSAMKRGISREQFINECNNPDMYRPETYETSSSHAYEAPDNIYYGP